MMTVGLGVGFRVFSLTGCIAGFRAFGFRLLQLGGAYNFLPQHRVKRCRQGQPI